MSARAEGDRVRERLSCHLRVSWSPNASSPAYVLISPSGVTLARLGRVWPILLSRKSHSPKADAVWFWSSHLLISMRCAKFAYCVSFLLVTSLVS